MKNLIIALLLVIISSCNNEVENFYALNLSDNAIRKLNQKIETIASQTQNDFNLHYTNMIGALEKYDVFSHIGMYKTTDEYKRFIDYCKTQDKKIYLLLIKKVVQDYNYLACEALNEISENIFEHKLEFSKATGISEEDVKAAYIILIEKLINEI